MPKIIIPFPFRKYADNQREVTLAGETFAIVLEGLFAQYPGLQVIKNQSDLLSIFINGKQIRSEVDDWSNVPVIESDEISLILPIAGG